MYFRELIVHMQYWDILETDIILYFSEDLKIFEIVRGKEGLGRECIINKNIYIEYDVRKMYLQ